MDFCLFRKIWVEIWVRMQVKNQLKQYCIYSQKLLDHGKQSATDAVKLLQKEQLKKRRNS